MIFQGRVVQGTVHRQCRKIHCPIHQPARIIHQQRHHTLVHHQITYPRHQVTARRHQLTRQLRKFPF